MGRGCPEAFSFMTGHHGSNASTTLRTAHSAIIGGGRTTHVQRFLHPAEMYGCVASAHFQCLNVQTYDGNGIANLEPHLSGSLPLKDTLSEQWVLLPEFLRVRLPRAHDVSSAARLHRLHDLRRVRARGRLQHDALEQLHALVVHRGHQDPGHV